MRLQKVQDALERKKSNMSILKRTDAEVWTLCSEA